MATVISYASQDFEHLIEVVIGALKPELKKQLDAGATLQVSKVYQEQKVAKLPLRRLRGQGAIDPSKPAWSYQAVLSKA